MVQYDPVCGDKTKTGFNAFIETINTVIIWIRNMSIILATISFMVAGGFLLISGGDEKKIAQAKKIFKNTALGIVFYFWSLAYR